MEFQPVLHALNNVFGQVPTNPDLIFIYEVIWFLSLFLVWTSGYQTARFWNLLPSSFGRLLDVILCGFFLYLGALCGHSVPNAVPGPHDTADFFAAMLVMTFIMPLVAFALGLWLGKAARGRYEPSKRSV